MNRCSTETAFGPSKLRKNMTARKQRAIATFAVLAAAIMIGLPGRVSARGSETFVSYTIAAVQVDGDPPKEWNLYHEEHTKFNEVVLLQWGKRYLRLDSRAKEVRELKPESVTQKKNSVVWAGDDATSTILPSSDWIFRDAGNVQRLHVVLTAESHTIEVDLPHYSK